MLAALEADMKRIDAALKILDDAAQANPNSADIFRTRSEMHFVSGNPSLAIRDLELCTQIRPDDGILWWNLGRLIFAVRDDTPFALECIQKALQDSDTDTCELHNTMGIILFSMGKFSQAKIAFETALTKTKLATPRIERNLDLLEKVMEIDLWAMVDIDILIGKMDVEVFFEYYSDFEKLLIPRTKKAFQTKLIAYFVEERKRKEQEQN